MRLDVAFTPAEVKGAIGGRVVVVIDVLRATSTIIEALVNGGRSVLPVQGVDEAVRRASELGRDSVLLCGERDAEPIRGFDFGNSPLEFTPERVKGRSVVMSTTNGTGALLATAGAAHCFVGAFVNVSAVAQRLADEDADALLLCAGREGNFALEDAQCAGRVARRIRQGMDGIDGNDAMRAALRLARRPPTPQGLGRTAAGSRLREIGLAEDLAFCAQEDRYDVVPSFDDHRVHL